MQVVSDIHLEMLHGAVPVIERRARFLALCGDIGRPFSQQYRDLVAQASAAFDHVIIIAGNHEYFGGNTRTTRRHPHPNTMAQIDAQIARIAESLPNVTYLQNSAVMLDGVCVAGSTLWTFIPEEMRDRARKCMNDYRFVYVDTTDPRAPALLSPEIVTALHQRAAEYLRSVITTQTGPLVVLTHHPPTARNSQDPCYDADPVRCCYVNDLDALIRPPCVAWCFGHTHWRTDQLINGVRVVSSPVGYRHEQALCGGLSDPLVVAVDLPLPPLPRTTRTSRPTAKC
jgi:hypothetical protein